MPNLIPQLRRALPAVLQNAGEDAFERVIEFFTAENALQMVKRRAEDAGFNPSEVTCHTFRATGITTFIENGGDLETAQHIARHASASTTRIYDYHGDIIDQEEVERIRI